jgi:hypothetical protein
MKESSWLHAGQGRAGNGRAGQGAHPFVIPISLGDWGWRQRRVQEKREPLHRHVDVWHESNCLCEATLSHIAPWSHDIRDNPHSHCPPSCRRHCRVLSWISGWNYTASTYVGGQSLQCRVTLQLLHSLELTLLKLITRNCEFHENLLFSLFRSIYTSTSSQRHRSVQKRALRCEVSVVPIAAIVMQAMGITAFILTLSMVVVTSIAQPTPTTTRVSTIHDNPPCPHLTQCLLNQSCAACLETLRLTASPKVSPAAERYQEQQFFKVLTTPATLELCGATNGAHDLGAMVQATLHELTTTDADGESQCARNARLPVGQCQYTEFLCSGHPDCVACLTDLYRNTASSTTVLTSRSCRAVSSYLQERLGSNCLSFPTVSCASCTLPTLIRARPTSTISRSYSLTHSLTTEYHHHFHHHDAVFLREATVCDQRDMHSLPGHSTDSRCSFRDIRVRRYAR